VEPNVAPTPTKGAVDEQVDADGDEQAEGQDRGRGPRFDGAGVRAERQQHQDAGGEADDHDGQVPVVAQVGQHLTGQGGEHHARREVLNSAGDLRTQRHERGHHCPDDRGGNREADQDSGMRYRVHQMKILSTMICDSTS